MIRALAITGPTASGKTALSLAVAQSLGCEIISCDSMQIYKEMDIGTAKATVAERSAAVHHLIDFLSPSENSRQYCLSGSEILPHARKTPRQNHE